MPLGYYTLPLKVFHYLSLTEEMGIEMIPLVMSV